ncbi:MAG TPA: hypothetical protein VKB36_18020, partial [Vicinamibacterales bacterium]|nr:hypothetical protein [Vicinamibacterales bacterium]
GHGATISFNTDSSEDQFVFDLGSTDLTCAGKTGAFGVGSAAPIRDIVEFCSVAALKHLFTADGAPGGQTAIGGTANSENLRLQSTTQPTRGSVIIPDNTRIGDTGTASHALEVTTANIAASGGATATFDVSGTLTTNQDALIDLCPNDLDIGLGGGLSSMLNTDNCLINLSGRPLTSGWLTMIGFDPTIQNSLALVHGSNAASSVTGYVYGPTINAVNNQFDVDSGICPAMVGLCNIPQTSRTGTPTIAIDRSTAVYGNGVFSAGTTITDMNTTYTVNPTNSGTITNLIAHDIADLTAGGTNMSLRSQGTGVTLRHAGSAIFGATSAPGARLDVQQAAGASPDVKVGYGNTNFTATTTETRQVMEFSDTFTAAPSGSHAHELNVLTTDPTITMSTAA